jgi:hypothetical protein
VTVLRLTTCLTPHGHLTLAPSDDAPELDAALRPLAYGRRNSGDRRKEIMEV